ncbi:hypothetical protein [Paenisporosarcina indica]|uniref:hypothetical protein n=1 Tax=Paenisporosarcina indica TaxID=650093 RepID=UPI0009500CDC|nr:hypothetical protein [Paenisporosarcina indica]
MEVILIAIITMIIGAFSKKKNADDANGKGKPFMSKPLDSQPLKKVEDYAREVFKDVQQRTSERQSHVQPKSELKSQMNQLEEKTLPSRVQLKEINTSPKRTGRLSVHQPADVEKEKTVDKKSLVPSTKQELVQAIIFSEILAPPKSKR